MKSKLLTLVIFTLIVFGLSGCASMGSSNTIDLLSASGFKQRTPVTAREFEIYNATPAYQVHRIEVEDKVFYVFKDEDNGIAYLGDEENYQKYKELAIQQDIAQKQYQAAQMQQDMSMGWYGAYGPYFYGPRYRHIGR